jgi:hypothetical protein
MQRVLSLPGLAPRYLPSSASPSLASHSVGWAVALLFIALLLVCVPRASAEERAPAGRILVTTGTVEAVAPDGTVRNLRRRARVYEGETVRTGERGRTQIRFTDGALLSVRPNTRLRVDEYRFANSDADDRKALTLDVGSIRTVTGRIGSTNRAAYRVSTPLAVIGIRGTDWEALQVANGPLLLGVNAGGITAQSTTGNSADIGAGANFNYAQVSPEGTLQLLVEPPPALVEAAAVDEQVAAEGGEEGGDGGSGEQAAEGEGGAEGDAGAEGEAGEAGAEGETGEVGADAPPTPPPPSGGGESSGGTADGGGSDGGGLVANEAAAPPPVVVSINPSEVGTGAPATTDPISRVLTAAEEDLIVTGSQLALVSGIRLNESSPTQALLALAGPDDDDTVPSFNFAFPTLTAIPSDRRAALNGASRLVQREGVPVSGRVDNVGGITGLTFARYDASATTPLPVFTDPTLSTRAFDLTSPYVFAIFNPANVASLTGRLQYTPANSLISVATGTVSTLVSDIVLDVNLGSGTVERGVLDIGYGATADAFVFLGDFEGTLANGLLNGVVTDIVLQDNGAAQTFGARGTLRGAFTGSGVAGGPPPLVLSFDFSDTAGRNQFARGVIQYTGATAPPPPSLALSATEAAQVNTGFFFLAGESGPDAGVAAGRASNAADTLGRPVFVGTETALSDGFARPSDPVFGTLPPQLVARQGGAPTSSFVTGLGAGFETVSLGRWLATTAAPFEIRDAATGVLTDTIAETIYWATLQPTPRASLVGTALLSTGTSPTFLGEFGTSEGARLPLLGVRASMVVDFDTGNIDAGNLFLLTESSASGEFGFDVQFSGSVINGAGGGFAEFTAEGGAYRGRTPLNLGAVELLGAFTGSGATTGMVLQFNVESQPVLGASDFALGVTTLGTAVDTRLTAADLASIDRVGIALFQPVNAAGVSLGLPSNLGPGVIAGRAGVVNPANPASFFIAANNVTRLESAGLSALPSALVVSDGRSFVSNVETDVGSDPAGPFAIGWGRWVADLEVGGAAVQTDPANAAAQVVFVRDVLFASVRPTDVGAVTGVANYSGTFTGGTGGAELLAFGGPLGGPNVAFDLANVNVNVDFNSGLVNGNLLVGSSTLDTDFTAQFNGRLNRNVADLAISVLDVRVGVNTTPGDLTNSSGIGVVTGATGDQFFTGFELVGGGQHVEGFVTSGLSD